MTTNDGFNHIALVAEYNFTLGGAQRLLAEIARRLNKPVYLPFTVENPVPVWNTIPLKRIPEERILFSVVVDRYQFRTLPDKQHIKFCHSGTSLENFTDNREALNTPWITHRERARHFWSSKGFDMTTIPKGYIPYDKYDVPLFKKKTQQVAFVSRICNEKRPKEAIEICTKAKIPLVLAGSWEFADCVNELVKNYESDDIRFVRPTDGFIVSDSLVEETLDNSKIIIHGSSGGLHDYLEYSLLDGMRVGCVPLCITPDPVEFSIIEECRLGRVVTSVEEGIQAIAEILDKYESYQANIRGFMQSFIDNQDELWERWIATILKTVRERFSESLTHGD